MVFAIHWHESAMDLHAFPILIPPSLSIRSLWVFPVHQLWALVACMVILFNNAKFNIWVLECKHIGVFVFFCYCCSVAKLCPTLQPRGLQHDRLPCPSLPISLSLLKLMSIESVMPSNHLFLCHPLLLPSISIMVFFNESACHIRRPQNWSFSFSTVLPMNIQGWFPLALTGLISLQSKRISRVFSNTTVRKYPFFDVQPSLWSNSYICIWLLKIENMDLRRQSDVSAF